MTTEMQKQAAWLSEIFAAVAKGETLQTFIHSTKRWEDLPSRAHGPSLRSESSGWRIKPKPRTFWVLVNGDYEVIDVTRHQARADRWRKDGHNVVETVEVLP